MVRISRAMDRSRRATNPQMFNPDGTIVPINKLPDECLSRNKRKRKWVESKRYKKLLARQRYLYRLKSEQTMLAHHELVNKLIQFGDEHYIEKMNWAALAKRSKETKISEKTGRYQRKKRFGKSIANKSPRTFTEIYRNKVESLGGTFVEINTFKAKASQYDHIDKAYKKKHLNQRWSKLDNGDELQRDLYSAFLIQNTNSTFDGFIQDLLEDKYNNFKLMHDSVIKDLKEKISTNESYFPSSIGIKAR
jgi:hypothetical protein